MTIYHFLKILSLCLVAGICMGCASQKGETFDQRWKNVKRWENEQSEKWWDRIMG